MYMWLCGLSEHSVVACTPANDNKTLQVHGSWPVLHLKSTAKSIWFCIEGSWGLSGLMLPDYPLQQAHCQPSMLVQPYTAGQTPLQP